jgi:hypothetical protein
VIESEIVEYVNTLKYKPDQNFQARSTKEGITLSLTSKHPFTGKQQAAIDYVLASEISSLTPNQLRERLRCMASSWELYVIECYLPLYRDGE